MGTEEKNKSEINGKLQEKNDEIDFILSRNIDADLEEAEKVLSERYQTFN